MTVRPEDRSDALVLNVIGEIDGLTAPRLSTAIKEAFHRLAGRPLVLDLSRVTFLGSPGLLALSDGAAQAATTRCAGLRVVVNHTRSVIRPIEITGLDGVLSLFSDVTKAVAP